MNRNPSKTEYFLLGIVIFTACLVLFSEFLLDSVFAIDVRSDRQFNHNLVKANSSESEWLSPDYTKWSCNLLPGHKYPVCGHEIYLGKSFTEGFDLSRYDSIKLWLKYKGRGKTVRLFLRTYKSEYSDPDTHSSTKYHLVEFETALLDRGSVDISLSDFAVAEWWLRANNIPLKDSHADLSNTVIFEVQTGSDSIGGPHYFELDRVEFHRKLLTKETWYLIIIVFLLAIFLCYFIFSMMSLKQELSSKDSKNKKLEELYSIVDKRSKEMEAKAKTDPLTGAFNREGIEEYLKESFESWLNSGACLSIVFLDVDYFKKINDTYGHGEGDKVLVSLASLIDSNIRSADWFARWGGEEFLLICQGSSLDEAYRIAEKIRALIEAHHFHDDFNVTASFGVASICSDESLSELFNRADEALYEAKNTGRNRVVCNRVG